MREKPGRPKLKDDIVPINIFTCSNCHAVVGKGMSHSCTRSEMQTNLVDMIRSKSPKTQQQVASKMLDVIIEEEGKTIQGCSVVLSTKGTPKTVTIGKSQVARPCPKYSLEDLTKLQTTRNLSDKDTLAVASFIRIRAGQSSLEPYLKKGLTDQNNKLDGMFMEKEMSMKVKPKKTKSVLPSFL